MMLAGCIYPAYDGIIGLLPFASRRLRLSGLERLVQRSDRNESVRFGRLNRGSGSRGRAFRGQRKDVTSRFVNRRSHIEGIIGVTFGYSHKLALQLGKQSMTEVPKPSEIKNVFAMNEPQHMVSKLLWEIGELNSSQSVWEENGSFPTPIFQAWNTAVTAWHITDWLWASRTEIRSILANEFGFQYEETAAGIRKGLERFQDAVAAKERALYVCREIANGSKHMRRKKSDPSVEAKAIWRKAIEGAGLVVPGDLLLSLEITDGNETYDAVKWFIDAFGYWEVLFRKHGWISAGDRLPDKIIKACTRVVRLARLHSRLFRISAWRFVSQASGRRNARVPIVRRWRRCVRIDHHPSGCAAERLGRRSAAGRLPVGW